MPPLVQPARRLLRSPLITSISIVMLGIGVGLTTSMVSLFDALLLQPAPFHDPSRLLRIESVGANGARSSLSVPEIRAITETLGPDVAAAPFRWINAILVTPDAPTESYVAVSTTGTFFRDFGVPALIGRTYLPADVPAPDTPVAVLGYDFWRRRFGADPAVVGRTVQINQRAVTILGVMPESFDYRRLWSFGDLWMPGTFMQDGRDNLEARMHALVIRLPANLSERDVRARLAALASRLATEHPVSQQGRHFLVSPVHISTVEPAFQRLALVATGVSVMVLLIVCTNLASLQLSRTLKQEHEFSVRAALGASPRQLLTQRLGESLWLGCVGGGLGLLIAAWCNYTLSAALTVGLAGKLALRIDPAIFSVSLSLALGTSLAASWAPALLAARVDVNAALRQQSRGATGSRRTRMLRQALVVLQVALAITLVSGAAILFRGLEKFVDRPVGWEPQGMVFGTVILPVQGYEAPARRQQFHDALEQQLANQPGITHATLSSLPPVSSYWLTRNLRPEGRTGTADVAQAYSVLVAPSYFETTGIALVEGRSFSRDNRADTATGIIINQALAAAFWPGQSAVGQRLTGAYGDTLLEVVGVVRNVDFPAGIDAPTTPYQVYEPFSRDPWSYITIGVRGKGASSDLIAAMRRAVTQVDATLLVQNVTDVSTEVQHNLANLRLATRSLIVFGATGLALALLGIYGTVDHYVAQRRRELGIRLALGATPRSIARFVVGQGLRLVIAGLAMGALGAVAAGRILATLVARVASPDPLLLLMVGLCITAAALLACWLPARAAAGVDPVETIRSD